MSTRDPVLERCAVAALAAGRAIREAVHAMPPAARGRPAPAALKPGEQIVLAVDAAAEAVGPRAPRAAERRHRLSDRAGRRCDARHAAHGRQRRRRRARVRDARRRRRHHQGRRPRQRPPTAARCGSPTTAAGASPSAFTAPTGRRSTRCRFGDFVVAAVVDGNPPRYRAHPARGGGGTRRRRPGRATTCQRPRRPCAPPCAARRASSPATHDDAGAGDRLPRRLPGLRPRHASRRRRGASSPSSTAC